MRFVKTKISGCYEIIPDQIKDKRGLFVKTYNKDYFDNENLKEEFVEEFYTVSKQRVLRGLHFQLPPKSHTKMVYCIQGSVLDVILDIRLGSPTYGEYISIDLSAEKSNIIYIPPGIAHGFYVLSKEAVLVYKISTTYSQPLDSGIRWDSAGINWPDNHPIISERDENLITFDKFDSPFIFQDK